MEGIDLTVYRVGLDIECHHLEGIGMHKEGVALREINGYGTVCTERKTGMFVVLSIVTGEFVLVNGVNKDHITESFAVDGVARCSGTFAKVISRINGPQARH